VDEDVRSWVGSVLGEDRITGCVEVQGSLAGNKVYRVSMTDHTDVILKHVPEPHQRMDLEVRALTLLNESGFTPKILGYSSNAFLMEYVEEHRTEWTSEDAAEAFSRLTVMRNALSMAGDGFPSLAVRHTRYAWVPEGYSMLQRTRGLEQFADPAVEGYHYLRSFPLPECVPVHTDTWQGNWILRESSPVLIDFGNICMGPYGYDEVTLIAFLPLPVSERVEWVTSAGVPVPVVRACALNALLAVAASQCHEGTDWGAWGAQYFPAVREFAEAVVR